MNRRGQMMAVQGVETQVVLLLPASLPNFCVSDDHKFNGMPQRHRQAAVLRKSQVHTEGGAHFQAINWEQNTTQMFVSEVDSKVLKEFFLKAKGIFVFLLEITYFYLSLYTST